MTEAVKSPELPPRRRHKNSRRSGAAASAGLSYSLHHPKAGRVLFGLMVLATIVFVGAQWQYFSRRVAAYGDLWIGMSPEEAQYFAGHPSSTSRVSTDGAVYMWHFNEPNPIVVRFADGHAVELACSTTAQPSGDCPSALGLDIGDSELALYSRLGSPTASMLANGRKILVYDDIGYRFVLERAEIRGIGVREPVRSAGSSFLRFLRWLLP